MNSTMERHTGTRNVLPQTVLPFWVGWSDFRIRVMANSTQLRTKHGVIVVEGTQP